MPEPSGGHETVDANLLSVTIVTPGGTRADVQARQVRAPGVEGEFGVLPGHVPFLTALRIGAIILDTDTGKQVWATTGGFAEVLADRVTILAEHAERSDVIDIPRAEAARRRALDRLAKHDPESVDMDRANTALARAINRIRVAGSIRGSS